MYMGFVRVEKVAGLGWILVLMVSIEIWVRRSGVMGGVGGRERMRRVALVAEKGEGDDVVGIEGVSGRRFYKRLGRGGAYSSKKTFIC